MTIPVRRVFRASLLFVGVAAARDVFAWQGDGDLFGSVACAAGDLDADGVTDVLVAAPWAGGVLRLSGKDGRMLGVCAAHGAGDGYGAALAAGADIDGDHVADFAVAASASCRGFGAGYVELRSGATGELRRTIFAEAIDWVFGRAIGFVPDLDGDGIDDLAVASERCEDVDWRTRRERAWGVLSLYSTRDGARLATLESSATPKGFASSFLRVSDLDGDGFEDLIIGASAQTHRGPAILAAYSSRSGRSLFTLEYRSSIPGELGRMDVGDLDGDGCPDLLVVDDTSLAEEDSRVVAFSGTGYRPLACDVVLRPGNGARLRVVGDVDRDGADDFVVACDGFWTDEPARLHSGRTGAELREWPGTAAWLNDWHQPGASVVATGDIDGDDVPDLLLGDVNSAAPGVPGCVELVSGATGELVWRQTWLCAMTGTIQTPRR
ncbi:MAG: FG-GAP repeat protein [Planctomycetes bacterium]|nr:FG-GAP repeat protein [Planctomycetota bacterium]